MAMLSFIYLYLYISTYIDIQSFFQEINKIVYYLILYTSDILHNKTGMVNHFKINQNISTSF